MKICVLSMQRVLNYGSLLQAYSLKKIIKSLGHDVSFIDIEPNAEENELVQNATNYREGIQSKNKGLLYRLQQQDSVPIYIFSKIRQKKQVTRKQLEFASNVLELDKKPCEHYDVCVIGSDEVFNFMNPASWGFTSQLFGNVSQANKVITYAACCGFSGVDNLTPPIRQVIEKAFENVKAFSVRDNNTKEFVLELTGRTPHVHLDPVLVGDFSQEIESTHVNKKLPKRYCIVYSYNGRINNQNEIQMVTDFCKRNKMTLVSIGGYQKWVHKHLVLTPFEVLKAFENATFVITDTFHGTVFSAKYSDKFAIIIRDSNRNKMSDLIEKLHIQQHVICKNKSIDDIYAISSNKTELNEFLQKERFRSIKYIEDNL